MVFCLLQRKQDLSNDQEALLLSLGRHHFQVENKVVEIVRKPFVDASHMRLKRQIYDLDQ